MKKLIALMLCLLMVLGMVACGATETTETTESTETTETTEATEATEESLEAVVELEGANNGLPADISFEGQTLTVWTGHTEGTETQKVYDEYVAKFEEMTGADVTVVHHGRDLTTILPTALVAGEDIDCFPLGSQIQLGANVQYTMDLTEYIEASDVLQRAYPVQMKSIKDYGGGVYRAIPTISSFNGWWYNKAIFEAAGVAEAPKTIDEFEAACDAIVAAGYYPIALDGGYVIAYLGSLVERTVGASVVGDLVMNGGFAENEKFVAACQRAIDWVNKGYFEPGAPGVWPASQNMIGITQDVAMVYTGMWVSKEIEEASGASLDWGCFKFPEDPTCEEGTYGISASATCHCVNANCDNPELAWAFNYYMCTGEADKAITDADVYVVNDMTQPALARFADAQKILAETEDYINYAGGLHDNADIKASVNDVALQLFSGEYADGLEAAKAFDALLGK